MFWDLQDAKYTNLEFRISVYGRIVDEWDKLAGWAVSNNVYSDHNRWLIIKCLCQHLFEVTIDPSSHPDLLNFSNI